MQAVHKTRRNERKRYNIGEYGCAPSLTNRDKYSKTEQTVLTDNFLALPKQTAHRAKFGETGR